MCCCYVSIATKFVLPRGALQFSRKLSDVGNIQREISVDDSGQVGP